MAVSGKCIPLDFGRRNTMGQYAIALYDWTPPDHERYVQFGEPPQTAQSLHHRTPILRVNFLRLKWNGSWHPSNLGSVRQTMAFAHKFKPSLVICDTYGPSCQRYFHNRYLVPSEMLPAERRIRKRLLLGRRSVDKEKDRNEDDEGYENQDENGDEEGDEAMDEGIQGARVLHEYSVDIDRLSSTFQDLLSGEAKVCIGPSDVTIDPVAYCCFIGDMWQAGQKSGMGDSAWDKADKEG